MSGLFHQIYLFCRRHPLGVIIAIGLILGLSVFSISKLKLSENILDLIPGNDRLDEISETIGGLEINNQITLHFYANDSGSPQDLIQAAAYVKTRLENRVPDLVKEVRLRIDDTQIDSAYAQIYNYLPYYLTDADYESMAQSTSPDGIAKAMEGAFKSLNSPVGSFSSKYILKDPLGFTFLPLNRFRELSGSGEIELYKDHLFTADRQHLLAFAILKLPSSETLANAELVDSLNAYADDVSAEFPSVTMSYFGAAAVAVANARQIRIDIYLTVGLASIFLLILILSYFKRVQVIFLVLLPGIFGALISGAILSLINHTVSTVALAAGSALLGITIDYALHFLAHAKDSRNIRELYKDLTAPVLICGVTTASAFFSLLLLGSHALADLGLFAGISVLVAAISTLIFLPLLTANMNLRKNQSKPGRVENWFGIIARKQWHKSKLAWVLIIGITLVSSFTWRNYSFETDMLNLNFMPKDLEKAENELNKITDYSKNTIYLASRDKSVDAALEKNNNLDSILTRYESQGIISGHLSFNTLIPSPSQRAAKLERWNAFWNKTGRNRVINTIDSVANSYGFAPGVFHQADSLINIKNLHADTDDLKGIVNLVGGGILLNEADTGAVSILSFAKLIDDDKAPFINLLQEHESVLILDQGYITTQLITQLEKQFGKLVKISLLIVFLILLLSYGRIELAILAFIPTALSWFWILGIMGVLGLSFNIINVIISTFIFGLGIDYSVFQLRGLLQGYASGKTYVPSYRKSILLSALTTVLGIGVLIFAEHPALKSIASLAIIGLSSVVLITFVVQPFLFGVFIGNRKKKGLIPFSLLSFYQSALAFGSFLLGCIVLNIIRLFFLIPIGSKTDKKLLFHRCLSGFCWFLVAMMLGRQRKVLYRERIDFDSPSIIIANHHSFIDILYVLSMHHKVVIVTNDWVYNSPFFGTVVRYADFIPATEGIENQEDKIQGLIDQGFSVVIFPEGTRHRTNALTRFHKGAFYLSERLQVDIQPLIIHGAAQVLPRGDDFYLKMTPLTPIFLPRIAWNDPTYGKGYRERAKSISNYFKSEYYKYVDTLETPDYFKYVILKNYIYKGPVLEWYLRIKIRLEKNYMLFDEILPKEGRIIDLGCGYGFMSQALAFSAPNRELLGIDYDKDKIEIAQNCPEIPKNLKFECGDVMDFSDRSANAFIISDVLHYLEKTEQEKVLNNLSKNLLPEGMIVIRDGDASMEKRHRGSVLTEVFSTKSGFNKTRNELNFISSDFIRQFAEKEDLDFEVIDNTNLTSNLIYILRSRKNGHGRV